MTGELILLIVTFVFVAYIYKDIKNIQEAMGIIADLLIKKEKRIDELKKDVKDLAEQRDYAIKKLEEQEAANNDLSKQLAVYKELAEQAEEEAYKKASQVDSKTMLF